MPYLPVSTVLGGVGVNQRAVNIIQSKESQFDFKDDFHYFKQLVFTDEDLLLSLDFRL